MLAWSENRPGVESPSLAIGNLGLGVGFAMTAALLSNQPEQAGNARLFILLTLVWVAGEAGLRSVGPLTPFLILIGSFTQVVAAAVLLRYPGRQLERPAKILVIVTATVLGLIQVALQLTSTPATWEERLPEVFWPSLWPDVRLSQALWNLRYAVWAIAAVVFLILLWRRWEALRALERKALAPILFTAAVAGVLIALRLVDDHLPRDAGVVLAVTRTYAAAAVSAAFVVSAFQLALARGVVGELATELTRSATVERVRDALRRALADPTLDVWYWVPEQQGYVDDQGEVRSPNEGQDRCVVDVVTNDGRPMALVRTDPALQRHRTLLDSAVAVSRLAIENAQLQASLRAQLLAVREARARLMRGGLEQRRQLERDLHDGAQQRLLAVNMRLSAIGRATDDDATAQAVESARHELLQALEELRNLAHGLYPAALSHWGLEIALEAVIGRLPLPVHANIPPSRWPPDVESAAYLITCEALSNACKHAGPCTVKLDISQRGQDLVIDITDDGVGSPNLNTGRSLSAIRDRVDAMGGHVFVDSAPGAGTRLVAEIPCG